MPVMKPERQKRPRLGIGAEERSRPEQRATMIARRI